MPLALVPDAAAPPATSAPEPRHPLAINHETRSPDEILDMLSLHLRAWFPNRFWTMDGRRLVELNVADGTFSSLKHERLTSFIRQCAFVVSKSGTRTMPSQEYGRSLAGDPARWFPALRGVRQAPYLTTDERGNGFLVTSPGYDVTTETWLHWQGPPVEIVHDEEIRAHVIEQLSSFTFKTETDRLAFFAFLLQPLVQTAYAPKPSPEWFVSSVVKDSGKTYLVMCASTITVGYVAPSMPAAQSKTEAIYQLHGMLQNAPAYIFFDNTESGSTIGGAERNRLITASGPVSVRPTGTKGIIYVTPAASTWVVTANQPELDEEHSRRSVMIELSARKPIYVNANLQAWCLKYRATILGVLLGMVQAWLDDGTTAPIRKLSSFGQWSNVVGGIVCHAFPELRDHWLHPKGAIVSQIDQDWAALFSEAVWPRDDGEARPLRPGEVLELLTATDFGALKEVVLVTRGGTEQARTIRMGHELRTLSRSERLVGGYRLCSRAVGHTRLYWPR